MTPYALSVVPGREVRPHHILWSTIAHVVGASLSIALVATFLSSVVGAPNSTGRTLAVVACASGAIGTGVVAVRLAFYRAESPIRTAAQAYWTPTLAVAAAGAVEGPSGATPSVFALSVVFLVLAIAFNGALFWRREIAKSPLP